MHVHVLKLYVAKYLKITLITNIVATFFCYPTLGAPDMGILVLRGAQSIKMSKKRFSYFIHNFVMLPPISLILVSKDCSSSELSLVYLVYTQHPPICGYAT